MKTKNLVIALLLNWFALPGAGHWYLKHRLRSLIFMLPTLVGLSLFFYQLMVAVKSVMMTAHMRDHTAEALSLAHDIAPDQEPYLIGLALLIVIATIDIVWLYLTPETPKTEPTLKS
jgi:hypothetical protein